MYFVKKNLQFTFPCEFSVTAQDDNYLINYYLSLFTEASQIQFTGNYKIESREAQNVIQWNLMMADKEAEITLLTDQIESLNRALALDQKELDLLAESEEGLLELSRNINLTTQQVKVRNEKTF